MKPIWILLTVLLLALPHLSFKFPAEHITSSFSDDGNPSNLSDLEVRQRLNDLDGSVDLKYNSAVERNIKHYLGSRKKAIAATIGKSKMYFPIFEHFLQVNNLPDELKYLSVVESALNPSARSPVGASGLWQFMKGTGKRYGLKVDAYIDERNDPIKATEAAFTYLHDLHKRYNDWTLALAAYNCGPGRVNRAIRRAGTMDYWKLRNFLPSETKNYVPAFVAVTYIMNYYQSHGIQPIAGKYQFQNLRTTTLFDSESFFEISKSSDVSSKEIEKLNPAYKKSFIPKSRLGNYLTLPLAGMEKFKAFRSRRQLNNFYSSSSSDYYDYMSIPKNMIQSTYIVQKGERLSQIAQLLKCSEEELKTWNQLGERSTFYGQELIYYFAKENLNLSKSTAPETEKKSTPLDVQIVKPKKVLYHLIKEGETLDQINDFYSDVTLSEIIRNNNLYGEINLVPGEKLKIKDL
ncbi:MAG: transglycosylase SLT domain-containing protein [Bacteroidota bacterium]